MPCDDDTTAIGAAIGGAFAVGPEPENADRTADVSLLARGGLWTDFGLTEGAASRATNGRGSMIDRILATAGVAFILGALSLIWSARATITYATYVSGLGAEGMPTATIFMVALLCVAIGGALIGWAARDIRAGVAVLRWGTPAVSIWTSSSFFLLASQVNCTSGCPLPIQPAFFSVQDLVHITAAVLAFAAACWAMLQCAVTVDRPVLARVSLVASISVAVIAGAGGLMSIAGFRRDLGAWLEFVATTIGLGWIALLGVILIARPSSALVAPSARAESVTR